MTEGWCAKHEAIKAAVGCAWCLKAEVERLRAKIEEVLALHSPNSDGDCRACSDDRNYTVEHPCWTVKTLRGGREK